MAGGRRPGTGPRDRAAKLKADAARLDAEARRLRNEAKWYDVGGDGEEIVAAVLNAGLPQDDGWHVIHSVVVTKRGSDIDHIVVGPPGVFNLNAKHHAGKLVLVSEGAYRVDGRRRDYFDVAMSESRNASGRLSVVCAFNVVTHPVLVVVGSADLEIVTQPSGVHVVDCDGVVEWLRSLPPVIDQQRAVIIAERAIDSATWLPPPPPTSARIRSRASAPARRAHHPSQRRRRSSQGGASSLAVIIVLVVVFVWLSHHPPLVLGTSSVTSTTSSRTFQAGAKRHQRPVC